MAHGDVREGKWRGRMRMEWVASSLALYVGTRSIQLLSADPHSLTASSQLNWHPLRFKWTCPFCWKTKSGFCACAITFRMCYIWPLYFIYCCFGNLKIPLFPVCTANNILYVFCFKWCFEQTLNHVFIFFFLKWIQIRCLSVITCFISETQCNVKKFCIGGLYEMSKREV